MDNTVLIGLVLAFIFTFFAGIQIGWHIQQQISNEWKRAYFELKERLSHSQE